jgi:hypothetical protein
MQRTMNLNKSQKTHFISAGICNASKLPAYLNKIFGQRVLAYRHNVRHYLFPRKEKILPVCS